MNKINSEVIKWLDTYAPGFSDLDKEDKKEIMYFSLLWSFFESQVLENSASAENIIEKVNALQDIETFDISVFLKYFKGRYVENNETNYKFTCLNFRRKDKENLVKNVLLGKSTTKKDILSALLIIVYRFRNNLFHGLKWADQFRDQFSNFKTSNDLLMKYMEISKN